MRFEIEVPAINYFGRKPIRLTDHRRTLERHIKGRLSTYSVGLTERKIDQRKMSVKTARNLRALRLGDQSARETISLVRRNKHFAVY
ncbi:MAG: hypothetical protein ACI9BW_003746 [Gammaproteobacteria bacterium]|jgi:hypothetical protein